MGWRDNKVSLTANPVREVYAAQDILKALGLYKGVEIISVSDLWKDKNYLEELENKVESAVKGLDKDIKIAVMGCVVNGPGEARRG